MKQDEIIEMPEYLNAAYEGDDLYTGDQVRKLMKLVAAKERELCKKECMEQFELSLSANEKAKSVRDKEAYLNSAIGAKYCLMRIEARGEA